MLIEDVKALLDGLGAGGGVWYGVNTTQPPVYPYVVFQRIVSTPNVSLGGPSALQNTRFQFDIYSQRISEAATLGKSLDDIMKGAGLTNVPLNEQDFFEPDTRVHRVSKDYSVWATN